MYKRIVVPLDGSKLAEEALPHLKKIADCSDVMLVSATEKITGEIPEKEIFEPFVAEHDAPTPPPRFATWQAGAGPASVKSIPHGTAITHLNAGRMAKTANDYLCRIAEKLEKKGYDVTTDVLIGNPAKDIVRFAEEQKADLILMASRGKPGLSRWNIENIAQKVLETSSIPVMLVKPAPGFKETKRKRKGVAF